jgi:hypothetical protein
MAVNGKYDQNVRPVCDSNSYSSKEILDIKTVHKATFGRESVWVLFGLFGITYNLFEQESMAIQCSY